MNKKEYWVTGIVLGIFIPSTIMVLFWWPLATLTITKIVYIPDLYIMISSLIGLAIGIIIDIIVLKRMIPRFYTVNSLLLIILYLFCSVFAVSSFMGLPIGNLVLGFIAGLYIGRKCYHINLTPDTFYSTMKTVSNFTASVTSIEASIIGFFMLNDESVIASTNHFLRLKVFSINRILDILIVVFLCIILYLMQFFLTKVAINFSYKTGLNTDR